MGTQVVYFEAFPYGRAAIWGCVFLAVAEGCRRIPLFLQQMQVLSQLCMRWALKV